MNRRVVCRITLWLVVGWVILGCTPPSFVAPPAAVSTPVSVETIIAQTARAAQTLTAISLPPSSTPTSIPLPTKTITITPTPTSTVVFVFLTQTSQSEGLFEEDKGTDDEESDSGYVKPVVVRPWHCRVISKSPAKGAVIPGGSSFKATWTVENIGTQTWPKNGVDVVFHSGARLHDGKPYYDIPAGVGPGGTVTISIAMTAPKRSKVYSNRWSLRVGNRDFCAVKFVIEVK